MNNLKIKYGVSKQIGVPDKIQITLRNVDEKTFDIVRILIKHYKEKANKDNG